MNLTLSPASVKKAQIHLIRKGGGVGFWDSKASPVLTVRDPDSDFMVEGS